MRAISEVMQKHLNGGATTLCRAWVVRRRDGRVFGFTDHDTDLMIEGVLCEASSGMDASAVESSTGLAVDNSQAVGALSSLGISDLDIETGRFDGAEVIHWLVNWQQPEQTILQFRGTIGEVRRGNGAFEAELRGLSEALNNPVGRTYLRQCDRLLGDVKCGVDLFAEGFVAEDAVDTSKGRRVIELKHLSTFEEDWFAQGKVTWLSGPNEGAEGLVKVDYRRGPVHVVELWEETRFPIGNGDRIRLHAGCDKQAGTCQEKFGNFFNFRGFPHMPGEDFSLTYPIAGRPMDGARRA